MTTLTADELADFRRDSGAMTSDMSDAIIQRLYDKAVTFGEDTDTTYARTMVYIIRGLMGAASRLTDLGGQIETEKRSQWFDHLNEKLLPRWEGLAGMAGKGVLVAGVLSLGIDFTLDDLENPNVNEVLL